MSTLARITWEGLAMKTSISGFAPAMGLFAFVALLVVGCATGEQAAQTASAPPFEGPAIIAEMVEAHGGIEAWRAAPSVSFEDVWGKGDSMGEPSVVTVEQGRRRAYIDFPGTDMSMCWDGTQAWSSNWKSPMPPRFMALLSYYFLNLPFLAMDPGVKLEETGTATLWDDPQEYITVRMSFEDGVGDTPSDSHLLYIDPDTKMLHADEYVATYKAVMPEGKTATDPHIVIYDAYEEVDGLHVPTKFTVYNTDGSVYTGCEVSSWSFTGTFDDSRMAMADGMVVDTSSPR